jgi:regulatory protein
MRDPDDDETENEPPTARMFAWARNSAVYRLSKAMMTERQLRDAIGRKARQKFEQIGDMQVSALADAAVRFAYDNLALDDQTYAEVSTRSATRSGKSSRAIARKLSIKGIDRDMAAEAIKAADDFFAAVVHARKRRLGPFRREPLEEGRLAKEMASFARGGFNYETGRRILAMTTRDAEDVLALGPRDPDF